MKLSYTVRSAEETVELGKKIGHKLHGGDVLAYRGGLGAGKTTMTRGIVLGMGLRDEVCSPTFAIVNEYPGKISVCHFDMYRIADENDLESIGFYDYLTDDRVLVIEWSENISAALPKNTVYIDIAVTGDNSRTITIEGDSRFEIT